MDQQPSTVIIYPVSDVERAKGDFIAALGVEPYVDEPYYVGFRAGGVEIGLDPNGHRDVSGPVVYLAVADINDALATFVKSGSTVKSDPRDVGGGKVVAVAVDPDGNTLGLSQIC